MPVKILSQRQGFALVSYKGEFPLDPLFSICFPFYMLYIAASVYIHYT